MKKITVILAALVAMVSFSSCDNINTVAEDENVFVIEELRETADEYILRFRDSDKTLVVNKKRDLKPGMVVLVKQTGEDDVLRILKKNKIEIVDMPPMIYGYVLLSIFLGILIGAVVFD